MRLIDSFVEIIPQEPTFEGALKAVELAARVSHLSEEKITDDSYKEFCDKLLSMGHLSPFEFGTVYLTIPSSSNTVFTEFFYRNNKYSKTLLGEDKTYVTTNLNRESGYGRFDIMLKPRAEHRDFPAVVIEVKAAKTEADDLDALAAEARRQIDEKNYAASLVAEGITDIMKFGIAFFAKRAAIAK